MSRFALSPARLLSLLLILGAAFPALAAGPTDESLQAAAAYSAAHGGTAILVRQHGKTLFSGGRTGEPHKIYSGTKGFWVLAALAAQEEGILRLDERASETLPEWREDPRRAAITLRELLSFTSGLEPLFHLHSDAYANRNQAALHAAVVGETGRSFIYGPAALQVFEEVFRRKLAARGETPIHYLEQHVLHPLGLGSQNYKADRAGNPLLATGFLLTPMQWSREGEVILAHGRPIVSAHSLDQCFHGSGANRAFGIGFWLNHNAAEGGRENDIEDLLELNWAQQDWRGICLSRHAPSDTVAAVGSGYQRMYVIPDQELIAVRFGNGARFSDSEFLRLLLGR